MSEAIRKILDAVTDRVFAYRPKDKGQQAKKIERRVKRERKKAEKVDVVTDRGELTVEVVGIREEPPTFATKAILRRVQPGEMA